MKLGHRIAAGTGHSLGLAAMRPLPPEAEYAEWLAAYEARRRATWRRLGAFRPLDVDARRLRRMAHVLRDGGGLALAAQAAGCSASLARQLRDAMPLHLLGRGR